MTLARYQNVENLLHQNQFSFTEPPIYNGPTPASGVLQATGIRVVVNGVRCVIPLRDYD